MAYPHRSLPLLASLLLLACTGSEGPSVDASPLGSRDASQDQPDSSMPEIDAQASIQPEYDGDGCLTFQSASLLCEESERALCNASVGCGHSDLSQCSIDCTMATVLCLDSAKVDACRAAVASNTCTSISACEGWLYF